MTTIKELDDFVGREIEHLLAQPGIDTDPERVDHDPVGVLERPADTMRPPAEVRLSREIPREQEARPDFVAVEKPGQLFARLFDMRQQGHRKTEP